MENNSIYGRACKTWPHKNTDWADNLARVEPVYIELAKHITAQQALVIVAHDEILKTHINSLLNDAGIEQTRVYFVALSSTRSVTMITPMIIAMRLVKRVFLVLLS